MSLITIWRLDLRFSEDHIWIYIYICVTVSSFMYNWGDRLGNEMTFRMNIHIPSAPCMEYLPTLTI